MLKKKSEINIREKLFTIFLFFLPFTQALTFEVGFPVKISEILLLFLIPLSLVIPKRNINITTFLLVVFFFLVLTSFIVNVFWEYSYTLNIYTFRINQHSDSLLRLLYMGLNIQVFVIVVKVIRSNTSLLKFLIYGAVVSALYGWYLFFSSMLDLPFFKLFGMTENPQSFEGIIRCGTFKEGNFASLFLIISASIAFHIRMKKTGAFLLLSVISTFSSIGIISAVLFLIIVFMRNIDVLRFVKVVVIILPISIISFVYTYKTSSTFASMISKVTDSSEQITSDNFSKIDRLHLIDVAFRIGIDNPFIGVGPNNYPLHYTEYNNFSNKYPNELYMINVFERKNTKIIPNNVYLEVFSEYGIFGFISFLFFIFVLLVKAWRLKKTYLLGGLVSTLISFMAFPSFIMLFIWVFFGVICCDVY